MLRKTAPADKSGNVKTFFAEFRYRPTRYSASYSCTQSAHRDCLLICALETSLTRSTGIVHTSAKTRLTSVAIRIGIRVRIRIPIRDHHRQHHQWWTFAEKKLECGSMPNVMVALPNIGGASVQRRKVWLTPTTRVPCSNAAKTRKPLKLEGVPQTTGPISAVRRPKFTILSRHVEEVSSFNNFFLIVDTCLSCKDTARQICAMVPKWRFFASCIFSEQRTAHFRHAF